MNNTPDIILSGAMIIFVLFTGIKGIFLISRKINPFGKPPIHVSWFVLGKLCFVLTLAIVFFQAIGMESNLLQKSLPAMQWAGAGLVLTGSIFSVASLFEMGNIIKFGLPGEKTKLITKGIFRLSRHPMYAGFFLMMAGSVFYSPGLIIIIPGIIAIIIHHFIIIAEERYLVKTFGEEYKNYKNRVNMYFNLNFKN